MLIHTYANNLPPRLLTTLSSHSNATHACYNHGRGHTFKNPMLHYTHCLFQLLGSEIDVFNWLGEEQVHDVVTVVGDSNVVSVGFIVGGAAHAKYRLAACRKDVGGSTQE